MSPGLVTTLSQLPPDAKELELLETMLSVEMEPVDMLEPEREVLVPSSSSGHHHPSSRPSPARVTTFTCW